MHTKIGSSMKAALLAVLSLNLADGRVVKLRVERREPVLSRKILRIATAIR